MTILTCVLRPQRNPYVWSKVTAYPYAEGSFCIFPATSVKFFVIDYRPLLPTRQNRGIAPISQVRHRLAAGLCWRPLHRTGVIWCYLGLEHDERNGRIAAVAADICKI